MESLFLDKRRFSRQDVAMMLVRGNALSNLDIENALIIVQFMEPRRVAPSSIIVQEGFDNTGFMGLILQGKARIENEQIRRKDSLTITTVGSGHLVGELGLIDGLPRSATVRAITQVDMAVLERSAVTKLMDQNPRAACKLMSSMLSTLSERLRTTNKKLRSLHAINRSLQEELNLRNSACHSWPDERV
jgi:CRP-like cAMP-binding protein